ncbi:MAG: putative PEP-binding protein [Acidimicrobiales bacterium]
MTRQVLQGVPASSGTSIGLAAVLADMETGPGQGGGPEDQERALEALQRLGEDLAAQAVEARNNGHSEEADILEANRRIVEDPPLVSRVRELAARGPASDALLESTEQYALQLERLPDASLAARGADVRQLGLRSVRFLTGAPLVKVSSQDTIILARDLGPADVVELGLRLDTLRGIALVSGSVVSHVAIVARSLGLPLVVGLGEDLLRANDGDLVTLDGDRGEVIIETADDLPVPNEGAPREGKSRPLIARQVRRGPVTSRDGRQVALLCNVSSVGEAIAGIAGGAEGIGLFRTELAFLRARSWPTRVEHERALRPVFSIAGNHGVTVRTLDFGQDKLPPFLLGTTNRGLALTLSHPEALGNQLKAILAIGAYQRLRVLFPFVQSVDEMKEARNLLAHVTREPNGYVPSLGAMIESPEAVERADEIAAEADFLAIGTNDLQRAVGPGPGSPRAGLEAAASPSLLAMVSKTIDAAHAHGRPVEICGEAAGVPAVLALFVGLGADELSVAPARLDVTAKTIRELIANEASIVARRALTATSVQEVLALVAGLLCALPTCDERSELSDGSDGVLS